MAYRTEKTWVIFSIVIGAAISFLPGVVVVLLFDAKIPLTACIILWFVTTAVFLENWWSAENLFREFPNDSCAVTFAAFGYLMALLSFPAILLGARSNLLMALRYYGGMFVVLALLDVIFCIAYAIAVWKKHADEILRKLLPSIYNDAVSILVFALLYYYVLPDPNTTILSKTFWLAGAYLLFLIAEFGISWTFRLRTNLQKV